MLPSLGAAALAGLIGSPHCMGMCGGFAMACGGGRRGFAWHAGRLTTYALLGAGAGAVGGALPGPGWITAGISTILLVWFAAALAGLVPEPHVKIPGLERAAGRAARGTGFGPGYAFGLTTGLLPCGLVYAALALPVAAGGAAAGALTMVAFGLGTVPALVALTVGARRLATRDLRVRRALAVGVLLLGLLSVGLRQGVLPGRSHLGHASASVHTPPAHPGDPFLTAPAPSGR